MEPLETSLAPMRKLGLIGGMSWHSTMTYYRIINEMVAARRGAHSSAQIALHSLDFAKIRQYQVAGDWKGAADELAETARLCVADGADAVAICTNLMHKVAPAVESSIDIPLIHIADAVAAEANRQGWSRLGLLGTKWVTEEAFYADRLSARGIEIISPGAADRDAVDRIIFDELTQGHIVPASRTEYIRIIEELAAAGAEAVVLACTEIDLLITAADSPIPVIDSTEVHARELGRIALAISS